MAFLPRPAPAFLLCLLMQSQAGSCQMITGGDGVCALLGLEPDRASLHVGETLTVRLTPSGCDPLPTSLDWTSSAPDVAAVDSTGSVRALKEGTAEITAALPTLRWPSEAFLHLVVVP